MAELQRAHSQRLDRDAAALGEARPIEGAGPIRLAVSTEADSYAQSVDGITVEAVRLGRGSGPSSVQSSKIGDVVANTNSVRFPMAVHGTLGDDRLLAAAVRAAPPHARWCGIDLAAGMVFVYGPGTEHTGHNPPGLEFSFALVKTDQVEAWAEDLRSPITMPPRGEAHVLEPSVASRNLHRRLAGVPAAAHRGLPEERVEDALVGGLITALGDDRRLQRVGNRNVIDDRLVTSTCIEYAESVGRIPAIREMCLAAHVSERRLRSAFGAIYAMPPTQFFRLWGLSHARRRLLEGSRERGDTVSAVSLDVGFLHHGKFAGAYREMFGESPSETLATAV